MTSPVWYRPVWCLITRQKQSYFAADVKSCPIIHYLIFFSSVLQMITEPVLFTSIFYCPTGLDLKFVQVLRKGFGMSKILKDINAISRILVHFAMFLDGKLLPALIPFLGADMVCNY